MISFGFKTTQLEENEEAEFYISDGLDESVCDCTIVQCSLNYMWRCIIYSLSDLFFLEFYSNKTSFFL